MSEQSVVDASASPVTADSLAADLRRLGLRPSQTVLVHSSLSSLGWVCGGAVAVVEALLAVLGSGGTLVVPTHTGDLSDPSGWANPPVPEAWWETIRANMPAYQPASTPSRGMGAVPEVLRTWPGAWRSDHPHLSFAAVGPDGSRITAGHELADGLGEGSPLARLYELSALVLLLGVGHDRNTSLPLAQYRSGRAARVRQSGPVRAQGPRRWTSWDRRQSTTPSRGLPAGPPHRPSPARPRAAKRVAQRKDQRGSACWIAHSCSAPRLAGPGRRLSCMVVSTWAPSRRPAADRPGRRQWPRIRAGKVR